MPQNQKIETMDALTITDFKKNISISLNKIDAGERVYFRRGQRVYTIVPVQEENEITPFLAKVIEKGRKDYRDGKCIECKNHDELTQFLDSL